MRQSIRVLGLRTTLWLRFGYRPTARLLHRFNLHHTRRLGPLEPDGTFLHRCEWCGVTREEIPLAVTARRIREHRRNPEEETSDG